MRSYVPHAPVLLVFVSVCFACSAREASQPIEVPRVADRHAARAPAASPVWFEEAMAWPPITDEPFASEHLAEPHLAEVRVSPSARTEYANLTQGTEFAVGTLLVQTLREARTGRRGPVLAMRRDAEDWSFWAFEHDGSIATKAPLDRCGACHAGAPAPPVFGVPRALPGINQ